MSSCRKCFSLKKMLGLPVLHSNLRNGVNREIINEGRYSSVFFTDLNVPFVSTTSKMLQSSHRNQFSNVNKSAGPPETQNVSVEDVERHETVENWWDYNGPMGGLHAMNDLRIQLIRNGLENTTVLKGAVIESNPKYLTGIKILEVGCGGGILTEALARLGADVTGIDPSLKLITIAQEHASNCCGLDKAPTYINSTIEDHSKNVENLYDVVVASEVIEHVPDKKVFLSACIKTIRPLGSLFFTTPNRTTASWLGSIVIAENILRLLPKGIHEWDKFITPNELEQLLQTLGCKTVLTNGMMYNVVSHTWSWFPTTTIHYALHAVKLDANAMTY